MRILVENEIQRAITACKPSKIAVAYIGCDWNLYIPDTNRLEEIIISPTFGSNPRAISDIANKIGWDKVLFLDKLHAKTYIGKKEAVIGSANLTRNGLSGENLFEVCVVFNDENNLNKIINTFENLKKIAKEQYPTRESKFARLKELDKTWGSAISNKIVKTNARDKQSLHDFYLFGQDHFYVLWYQPAVCKHSDELGSIESLIKYEIHLAADDKPEKNKWAITWRITDQNTPHKTANLHWMYIHDIFENGVVDANYDYPKCAIQRKDMETPTPPFELTDAVVAAFKKAVQDKNISKYLIQDRNKVFNLSYSLKGIPLLINEMKDLLPNNQNSRG